MRGAGNPSNSNSPSHCAFRVFRSVILLLEALMRGACKYNWHLIHIATKQGAVVKLLTITLGGNQ